MMMDQALYAAAGKAPRVMAAANRGGQILAEAYCLPAKAQNALDTAHLWTLIVAGALGVIALILVGVGMFFQQRHGDGGQMLKSMGWWIGGAVLIGAATGIASIFLGSASSNCTQIGN
ncbi:hypothetical protein AX769_22530 (plasmid) [Frondihabitans sp. PAMC 28766]|nr:hypothetical protein AX769_22530 [Frondihabitans sp. PAMC 28766]